MTTETTTPEPTRRDPTAWLLLHCFVGPAIGTLVVALVSIIAAGPFTLFGTEWQWHLRDYVMIPVFLLAVLLPGWFFGFIPALAHAVIMLGLRRVIASRAIWLTLTPLVGWLAVFLPLLVIAGMETPDRIADSALMAMVGSIAAVGCVAIAWRRKMHPV